MSTNTSTAENADLVVPARINGLTVLTWAGPAAVPVDSSWVASIESRIATPVYSLALSGSGLTPVGLNREDLEGALNVVRDRHPDCAVLLLRAGLRLPEPISVLDQLCNSESLPDFTVFPGNYSDKLNPLAAWPSPSPPANPGRVVYWCGAGRWQWMETSTRDCLLIAPGIDAKNAVARNFSPCVLTDEAFACDPARPLSPDVGPDSDLETDSSVSLGQLRLRLRHLALSGADAASRAEPEAPVTLHIAHSWGGGVWRWIEHFILGDAEGVNLVLISDGDRAGELCGRGLKLFVGGIGTGLIRDIPLGPKIVSTVSRHRQYRSVLDELIERYGVGRIIVSSLIGHSLDCLETNLPTIQVLHDFYPVWPFLDFDPLPFARKKKGVERNRAMAEHGDTLRMRPRDAQFWNRIAADWRRSINNHGIHLVAPANHVAKRWRALNPGMTLKIKKISHAFQPFADKEQIIRRGPEETLHLVIPGRLTRGKGLDLLEKALPDLKEIVRITALGCGRDAFSLFGHSGIDLICNYDHADFPDLIRKVRPHAALFLSTVPETWNYALSEVRAMNLVPIATRIGSFPERIDDGKDGLLFDPDAASLIRLIRKLVAAPDTLKDLEVGNRRQQTPARLVSRFNALAPVAPAPRSLPRLLESEEVELEIIAGELQRLEARNDQLALECKRLDAEINDRTRWAEKLDQQLQKRTEWSVSLDLELRTARESYAELENELEEKKSWALSLSNDLDKAHASLEDLRAEYEERTEWSRSLDRDLKKARESYAGLETELEEKTSWALSLSNELDKARASLEALRAEYEERTEWSRSLDRELQKARETYADLESELEEKTSWALSLDAELEQARASMADLRAEYEERTEWSRSLDRELQKALEKYAGIEHELEERTLWALGLDDELEQVRGGMANLRAEYEERTEWALTLKQEKEELENVLGREIERIRADLELERDSRQTAESTLEAARQDVFLRENELAERNEMLAQASARLRQLEFEAEESRKREQHLETEFGKVVTSNSWRLTRPLRFGARLTRNMLKRGALNPLRWPRLIRRFSYYWKSQGFRQALLLLQSPPVQGVEHVSIAPQTVPEVGQIAGPVVVKESAKPDVSIIVPVYNQLHLTADCLQSLVTVQNHIDFEIIVVDDCSTDETPAWLKRCRGVRHYRNRRNKGFIRTCNRGARAAKGHWLVFLNNDTRVTDGWLDSLIETFSENPSAGIVGGRLVFADGRLQEAGGIMFRDASGWNYGRGNDPDKPDFAFLSEADYVSGACLAIERRLFAELGGFDTLYAPAYYEDTDLCFRVRERGLKVLYQPASTVIHFEGGTSGTDESAGEKKYQVVNREKFRDRWAETLEHFPDNPNQYTDQLARKVRNRRFPRRALVIDATTPIPNHDSGSVRMVALLKLLLDLGYQTSFLPENRLWMGSHSRDLQKEGIEVLTAPWVQNPEEWLTEHGPELDLVIVSRHYILTPMLKMIRALCPNAKLVFDTVDLHFLREQREAEISGTEAAFATAEKTRQQELELIEATDATLVVSQFERELLESLTPQAKVSVVSNIHSLCDPGKPFDERRDLIFVGGFQHPPNIDAAHWLIEEIMPRVLSELPDVTLHIIGSKMPENLRQRVAPGVKLQGFVADLEPYMVGCRVSVAPLRYGAGGKGKVNQAMSYGLPVVATSCAAEGMYTTHGVDILMADDAEKFAAEIVRLYQNRDLWKSLAENGRLNVDRYFSVNAARDAVVKTLDSLGLTVNSGDAPR